MGLFTKTTPLANEALKISARITRIREAQVRTAAQLREAEAGVVAAQSELATAAASVALEESLPADVAAARKRLEAARRRVADLIAESEGLEARRRLAIDELVGQSGELERQIEREISTRISAAMEKYLAPVRSLAGQLRSALLVADAAASVCDQTYVSMAIRQSFCAVAGGENVNLLDLSPFPAMQGGAMVDVFPIHLDPAAQRVHAEVASQLGDLRAALRIITEERRRAVAEHAEALHAQKVGR